MKILPIRRRSAPHTPITYRATKNGIVLVFSPAMCETYPRLKAGRKVLIYVGDRPDIAIYPAAHGDAHTRVMRKRPHYAGASALALPLFVESEGRHAVTDYNHEDDGLYINLPEHFTCVYDY